MSHPLQFDFLLSALLFFLLAILNDPLVPAEFRGRDGRNNASRTKNAIGSQGEAFQIFSKKKTHTKSYVDRLLLMSHMCRKRSCASAATNTTSNAQMTPHTIWWVGNDECKMLRSNQELARCENVIGVDKCAKLYLNRLDSHGGIKVDEIVMDERVGLRARQDQCGNACSELYQWPFANPKLSF
jgi:hypothetical protein